ncbi:DarT ssDNA thymidine ADP-ribosyltransferase family protein [Pseudomonas soli]|uniref:DarT ssDNA thymidine ADP-ribosyltransferase family protein n=1 Tax=Pseudomonas soli TaxID=1306993 RepID=UPI003DA98E9F
MKNKIVGYGKKCIWHFTDKSNLDSIRAHGLLSWSALVAKNIVPPAPGGNKWSHDADKLASIDDFVHLAFSQGHPMLHVAQNDERIKDPVWLQISLDVLDLPGVKFTKEVANKSGVVLLDNDEAKGSIDLEAILTFIDFKVSGNQDRKREAEKGQILVPEHIPTKFISGL